MIPPPGPAWAAAVAAPPTAGLIAAATVFTGTTGAAVSQSIALTTLEACPAYAGPGALTLHPGSSTYTLAVGSTWTVAEILDCGLQIPLSDVSAVQVLRPDGAAEAALSAAQLSDPSSYVDPAAPGALPVISGDGGQELDTYTRPWRGGGDENGADQVTDAGPIGLVVYETSPPLTVRITAHPVRRGTRTERLALSATVKTTGGATVPAAALDWSWTLSTGVTSTASDPVVSVPRGTTTVTVLVGDAADGTGGTTSFTVAYRPARSPRGVHRGGGGNGRHGVVSGLGHAPHRGPSTSRGTNASSSTMTTTTSTTTGDSSTTAPPTPTPTPTPSAGGPRSATTSANPATPARRARPAHRTPSAHHAPARPRPARATPRRRRVRPAGHLVRGRLIGAIVPVSAATSPLARPLLAAAPDHPAASLPAPEGRLTVPAAVLAGLAAAGLLGLGAARERRSRSHRLHR